MAHLIDGKAIAGQLRARISEAVSGLQSAHGLTPGLAVVLVGENPASQVYVRNKAKQTTEVGMRSVEHKLSVDTSQEALLNLVSELNADPAIHGILVQLPLPDQIDAEPVLQAIDPSKDVDGFHPLNAGLLATGSPALVPCTPLGSVILARTVHENLSGMHAVVIGRSNIVGKPAAQLLIQQNCTVTVAHSRTKDLPAIARQADLLVAAVGRPEMVRGDWVKPGATVIDVGINRIEDASTKSGTRLVGDVHFDEAAAVAGAITPVPGGVGPMTIACLLRNTVQSACAIAGVPLPNLELAADGV
ncbi:MAG: bifunctional methylenetetrahydrofolate dehydrogenase/methenyltetrahydrofolate cyclohydrolase FolD [Pseudomonadota bacterium]